MKKAGVIVLNLVPASNYTARCNWQRVVQTSAIKSWLERSADLKEIQKDEQTPKQFHFFLWVQLFHSGEELHREYAKIAFLGIDWKDSP